MSASANGHFVAYVNHQAPRRTADDRALMVRVRELVRVTVPSSQVNWAGSQRKGTAIAGSDLDMCVESRKPVTEGDRRRLRDALEEGLSRPVRVLSHALRMPAQGEAPKVDLAFANAAFGSRPLPDASEFEDRPPRQTAARALKLWLRSGGLPRVGGWAIEALVVGLDPPGKTRDPLELFLRIVAWLDERANPAAVEGILRPAAHPRWNPAWSTGLPGSLEAIGNHARRLRRRSPGPEQWSCPDDVEAWLCR